MSKAFTSTCVILSVLLLVAVQASAQDVMRGCVKRSGVVRILLDPDDECRRQETPISWNLQGPPGQDGQPGEPGPPGISGYEVVSSTGSIAGDFFFGDRASNEALCPAGKFVLGGGGTDLSPAPDYFALVSSEPLEDFDGWKVTVISLADDQGGPTIRVWAICAEVEVE